MTVSIINRKLVGGLGIAILLLGWQLMATLINMPLLLPRPLPVLAQIGIFLMTGSFWHHLGATLLRGLIGFGVAYGCGAVLGFLTGQSPWWRAFFRPLVIFVRSTPTITLIVLALLWLKGDAVALLVVFLVVFPLVVQNVEAGITNIDSDLRQMVTIYQVGRWRRLRFFYLPAVLPFLAAAAAAGLGMTWKVLIAAEVLSSPAWGIGAQLDTARIYLQTERVFAWTTLVVLIGLCFDYLLDYLVQKTFAPKTRGADERSC
jgi:NitT/TauT family transport system permease protein